jgi:hypothetical protein
MALTLFVGRDNNYKSFLVLTHPFLNIIPVVIDFLPIRCTRFSPQKDKNLSYQ